MWVIKLKDLIVIKCTAKAKYVVLVALFPPVGLLVMYLSSPPTVKLPVSLEDIGTCQQAKISQPDGFCAPDRLSLSKTSRLV